MTEETEVVEAVPAAFENENVEPEVGKKGDEDAEDAEELEPGVLENENVGAADAVELKIEALDKENAGMEDVEVTLEVLAKENAGAEDAELVVEAVGKENDGAEDPELGVVALENDIVGAEDENEDDAKLPAAVVGNRKPEAEEAELEAEDNENTGVGEADDAPKAGADVPNGDTVEGTVPELDEDPEVKPVPNKLGEPEEDPKGVEAPKEVVAPNIGELTEVVVWREEAPNALEVVNAPDPNGKVEPVVADEAVVAEEPKEGVTTPDPNIFVDAPELELAPNVVGVVPTLGPNGKVVPVVTDEVVAAEEPKENEGAEEAVPNPKLVDEVLKLGFDIENPNGDEDEVVAAALGVEVKEKGEEDDEELEKEKPVAIVLELEVHCDGADDETWRV